jgi:hypothetical protein
MRFCAVIRIRYCDLPAGLHIRIEDQGSHTTMWLLPGLTPAQRQAAIRRAKGAARVGQGPELPPAELLRALTADWLRAIVKNGLGAMRQHPSVFFPPLVVLMSAAVAYLLLVSVSIQFLPGPHPQAIGRGPARPVPHRIRPAGGPRHGGGVTRPPAASVPATPPPAAPSPEPTRTSQPSPTPTPTPVPTTSSPAPSPSPSTTPTAPSPSPSSQPPARRSPLPTKSPIGPPAPSPTGKGLPSLCVPADPAGTCLTGL